MAKTEPKEDIPDEVRFANQVIHSSHFEVHSVRQFRMALHYIPIFQYIIVFFFGLSLIFSGFSVWHYFNRNPPMLFLSLPDGSLRCPFLVFSGEIGKKVPRETEYQDFCSRYKASEGVLEDEIEFFKGEIVHKPVILTAFDSPVAPILSQSPIVISPVLSEQQQQSPEQQSPEQQPAQQQPLEQQPLEQQPLEQQQLQLEEPAAEPIVYSPRQVYGEINDFI